MRLNAAWRWFLAYTAAFAVLAGFVFWGTWSMDFAPVMPDSPIAYPTWHCADYWAKWTVEGRFIPNDLVVFLGSPYFWQELNYVIPAWLSGLAAAYFLRGRGLPRLACWGAGIFLAFCGYWLTLFSAGHGSWFFLMTYIIWPFGLADRAIRKNKAKNWLLLGATVGWACHWQPDIWLLFTGFIAVFFIYTCVREHVVPSWKGLSLALLAFLLVGGSGIRHAFVFDLAGREEQIKSGETVPTDQKANVDGDESRWIFVTNWSLPPSETAEFMFPRINGDTSCMLTLAIGANNVRSGVRPYTGALGRPYKAESGNYRQHSLYVGFVTCLLAFFAVGRAFFARRHRNDIAFFAAMAFAFWLCSLGRYCETVYRAIYLLPFGDTLRAPVKWHHLTEFCLVVLAGFGLAELQSIVSRFGRFGRIACCALVLVGAFDLARIARLYCAPVPVAEARRQNKAIGFSSCYYGDLKGRLASAYQARQIVPIAYLRPDFKVPDRSVCLLGTLSPWGEPAKPQPLGTSAWFSIVSMLASLAIAGYSVKKS